MAETESASVKLTKQRTFMWTPCFAGMNLLSNASLAIGELELASCTEIARSNAFVVSPAFRDRFPKESTQNEVAAAEKRPVW